MKENTGHKDELGDAPELRKLEKKNLFLVPDGYFEGLDKRLKEVMENKEEALDVLEGIGKENVFTVPEKYFDTILETFEKRKAKDVESPGPVAKLRKFPAVKYFFAVAAAVIILMLIYFPPSSNSSALGEEEYSQLSELALEDLIAAVEPEHLSEEMILHTFGGFEEWPEPAGNSAEEMWRDFGEDTAEVEGLIQNLDIYMLEEALEDLKQLPD